LRRLSAALLLLTFSAVWPDAFAEEPVPEVIRQIQASCSTLPGFVGDRLACAGSTIRLFYERRGYRPSWTAGGRVLPSAVALVKAIEAAPGQGLRAEDYHLETLRLGIERLSSRKRRVLPREEAELDLLLTDAFLLYGAHLLGGRVDPVTIHPDWIANRRTGDVAQVLERALAAGRIEAELEALAPRHAEYERLRAALGRYRGLVANGGWPHLSPGPPLRLGSGGARVSLLRKRLALQHLEAGNPEAEPDRFDGVLAEALREFQRRHRLQPDAVLGPATLAALNVPAEERLRQLEVNLERWRWLPQTLGARHIRVNVAGFDLEVREEEKIVLSMAVIVGKPYTRTPVFSSPLTYLVLNPTWYVPVSIARQELLPAAQAGASSLHSKGYRVFRGTRADAPEVDLLDIDWSAISPERLDLRFRQSPGPANALGRVKFMLPNRFDVYLHDTPGRGLFARSSRAFSHGCIRVEKPVELAQHLLRDQAQWSRSALLAAIEQGNERVVRLRESVPVHLLYQTAWVDEGGVVHFGEDVYGRDAPLAQALESAPPTSLPRPKTSAQGVKVAR
jgi:L,D-transpeptidase YcbB